MYLRWKKRTRTGNPWKRNFKLRFTNNHTMKNQKRLRLDFLTQSIDLEPDLMATVHVEPKSSRFCWNRLKLKTDGYNRLGRKIHTVDNGGWILLLAAPTHITPDPNQMSTTRKCSFRHSKFQIDRVIRQYPTDVQSFYTKESKCNNFEES